MAPAAGRYSHNLLVLQNYRLINGYAGLFPSSHYPYDSEPGLRLTGTRWRFTEDGARLPVLDSVSRVRLLGEPLPDGARGARLIVDRPGYLVLDVAVPERRVLALTERFHDGWTATADGRPIAVQRIDRDFLGCTVDPGVRRIELRFRPRSVVRGAIASMVGVLLVAAVIVWRTRDS
jgi:hypothetical protein